MPVEASGPSPADRLKTFHSLETIVANHPAQRYDDVPYPSLPATGSHPERLATIAAMRGMQPADVSHARVREMGCGTGENLLPVAERFPEARLLGIDFSAKQIELATRSASELGLSNVEFRKLDIARLPADLGTFDYITAHGVYSLVDGETREKLLAACRRHLAPQGVAYVSYNTYPGWHVHDMFRALMLYEGRDAKTTAQRVTAARRLLNFMNDSLAPENPFTTTVKEQLGPLMARSDAYLLHEYLEEDSHPVYYKQFIAHARRHDLEPAGDVALGIRFADYLGAESEQSLAVITTDLVEKEQFRDIVRNRLMRQTLLCHRNVELARSLRPELAKDMHFSAALRPENPKFSPRSSAIERFLAPNGLRISTPVPIIKAALQHLGTIWPSYASFDELVDAACALLEVPKEKRADIPPSEVERLQENLLQCCAGQIADIHRQPQTFVSSLSQRPTASRLARWQAARGNLVTNRWHESVRIQEFERHVLQLLDGSRDKAQLLDALTGLAAAGRFVIAEHGRVVGNDEAQRTLSVVLPPALEHLARNGLLVA
jgi:methyltransferase-like protein/SAM-dependent methyltransferase